jgi:predicted DNA-binding transcriptional regulator AlpA
LGKKWFFIWSYNFTFSSDDYYLMDCYLFLVNCKDRIKFDLSAVSQPRKLDVKTSGLYVNLDELAKLEREEPYFNELDTKVSNSGREEKIVKLAPTPEEPDTTKPTGTKKETSNMLTTPRLIDLQPVKCDAESISSSSPDLNADATVDQLSPASGSVQESHLIAQTKKQKKTKQPDKKKQITTPCNADTVAEPNPLAKVAREASPLNTFADLQTRILSLEDIIGDREKGIPAIIPVSKSTWYAGLKTGRYPKSYEVSEGRVAWRGSDIYALLQQMGMV